jgi:PAS domain S-box-containing protein
MISSKPTYEELGQRVKQLTDELLERDKMEKEVERIFNFSIDMIGSGDLQGYFTKINSSFRELLGYSKKEILERPFIKFVHDDDVEKTKQALKDARKGKKEIYIENRYKCKDGSYKWIEWKVLVIFKENKFIAVGRDITDRKRIEEELRKKTHDLDERIKELNCLYGISQIRERSDITFEKMLQKIVDLIPSSWQYPEIACARIIIESQEYKTKNFKETVWKQTSNIVVHGKRSGILEICYLEEKPKSNEGSFSKEERTLINAIAERLGRITEHKKDERALWKAHDELEKRVEERTRELDIKKRNLEEANIAFQVLLDKRYEDKKEMEENVLTNVKEMMIPYFEKIRKTKLNVHQKTILSILESYLNEIVSPFTRKISRTLLNLTPVEIEVANLIRHGSNSKEIANIMGLSPRTIYNHRKSIRKKLGIENKKTDLRSYLLSFH